MIALVLALMVEMIARDTTRVAPATSRITASGDVGTFVRPLAGDVTPRSSAVSPASDPFATDGAWKAAPTSKVASTSPAPVGRLTAILIADDGSVAVIDDQAVSVGGRLKSGERVASIREDRVWIVKPNGQWRALVLPGRGQ